MTNSLVKFGMELNKSELLQICAGYLLCRMEQEEFNRTFELLNILLEEGE